MKTDQLVSLLASGVAPVPPGAATRRIALALAIGVPLSVAIMLYDWGVRRDLALAMLWPMFWFKLLFPAAIAAAAFVAVQRLSRPGVPAARAWIALALPVLAVWALGLAVWFMAPEAERMPLLWGQTWRSCAFSIAIISAPVFVASLVALKGLAPTRPALAGACAGALAGGAGAAVYALHCPELAAPFLAVWYMAGIALPVLAGALLGQRLLRW